MDANQRKHERHAVDTRAYIESPMPCSIADVSATGAKLIVKDPTWLPDEFLVRLRPDLRKWCRVIWRRPGEVGIEFISAPKS